MLVEELFDLIDVAWVVRQVRQAVVGRFDKPIACRLQLGDFGIDLRLVIAHGFHGAQHVGLNPGLHVLGDHLQTVKRLADHALGKHCRFGNEAEPGCDFLKKGQNLLPVVRDGLQLARESTGLGFGQEHLLRQVSQDRQQRGSDLALHAFVDRVQTLHVVIELLCSTRCIGGHDQPEALGLFHHLVQPIAPLVEHGDHVQTVLAEQLDGQRCLFCAVGHGCEFFCQVQQHLLSRTNLPLRIQRRHPERLERSTAFTTLDLGIEHGSREEFERLGQTLGTHVRQLGGIQQCRQGLDRNSGFLGELVELFAHLSNRNNQLMHAIAERSNGCPHDHPGGAKTTEHTAQHPKAGSGVFHAHEGIVGRLGQQVQTSRGRLRCRLDLF